MKSTCLALGANLASLLVSGQALAQSAPATVAPSERRSAITIGIFGAVVSIVAWAHRAAHTTTPDAPWVHLTTLDGIGLRVNAKETF